jgi:hypothetical protein
MAASYGAPGVYIEEQPSGSMPIEGVGTAVAAFVGFTERYDRDRGDPTDPAGVKPQLVTSWPQYERVYGGFVQGAMLPHAVRGFFENGGSAAYICRIPGATGENGDGGRPTLSVPTAENPQNPSMRLSAVDPRANLEIEVVPPPAPAEGDGAEGASSNGSEYTLRVYEGGTLREELGGLQFSGRSARTVEKTVNERSKFVRIELQPLQGATLAERVPAAGRYPLQAPPVSAISVTPADLVGSESDRTGYQGLAIAENVTMVAIPDLVTVATKEDGTVDEEMFLGAQKQLIDWCEASHNKMAILDVPPGLNATRALEWRSRLARDSAFAALYYPNVVVSNPLARPGERGGPRHRPARDRRDERRAGPPEPRRGQLHPVVRQLRHQDLGRPYAGQDRPELALHQRAAAVQLRRGVDPARHPVGGVRAQRLRSVAAGQAQHHVVPARPVEPGRAGRRHPGAGVLCALRREQQSGVVGGRGQAHRRDRHRPGEARRVRHLPDFPVAGRRRRNRVDRGQQCLT